MAGTVGRIGIRVFPDLDQFNEKLKAGLEQAERKYKVEIPVRLKTTNRQLAEDIRDARNQGENVAKANNVKFRIPVGVKEQDAETGTEIQNKVKETNARLASGKTKFMVPVGINSSELARDLKTAINQAKAQLTAEDRTIKLILDVDKTRFERKFEELKNHYDGKEIDLKADVDRSGRAEASLAVLSRNRYVDLIVRIEKRSLATARATLAALTGANILRSTGLALERFAMNIDRYAGRFAALGLLLTTVASSGLSLVSSMTGLFADIGKLGGFALALPTALGSITAFTIAGIMAFTGFKDAINGSEEAMARLPENAQKAARALRGTWTAMQVPTQQAFCEQMGTAFTDLVDRVFPEVQVGLAQVRSSSGKMFREVLRSFTDLGGDGVFAGMFDNLAQGIDIAARGIRPFMGALIQLGSVGSRYLPQVGNWIREISTTFADWVRRSAEAGKINLWMENASKAAGNLGQAFKNAAGALSAIVQGTRSAGSGNLETLADTMLKIRRTAESNVFQTGMANILGGAHIAVQFLQDALGDLGRTLYVISPTIKQVLTDTGATVGNLLSSVATAMRSDAFQNGLGDFFAGIRKGVEGLTRYAPRVIDTLGDLGGVLGTIATEFGPVVGQVLAEVGNVFRELSPAIKELIPVFANFAANTLQTFFSLLSPIADVIRLLIQAFNGLPGPIQTAAIALALLIRLLGGGPAIFAPFLNSIKQIPTTMAAAMSSAAASMRNFSVNPSVSLPSTSLVRQSVEGYYRQAFLAATPAVSQAAGQMLSQGIPAALRNTRFEVGSNGVAQRIATALVPPTAAAAVQQRVNSAVGRINLSEAAQRSINQANQASTGAWNNFRASMTSGASAAVSSAEGALRTGGAKVVAAAGQIWTPIRNGFSSMWSLIGGGAGLALIGIFTAFSSYAAEARRIEQINVSVANSYRSIGQAAAQAGEKLGGPASVQAAFDSLSQFDGLKGKVGTDLIWGAFDDSVGLDQLLLERSLSRADVANYMAGVADDGVSTFLKETRDKLDKNSGIAVSRMPLIDWDSSQRDSYAFMTAIDDIIAKRDEAKRAVDDAWRIDPQKTSQAVLKNISDNISQTGKVTIGNIEGIQKGLEGVQNIGTDKVSQFAAAMANSLGDAGKGFKSNFDIISGSLVGFGATAEQIQKKDYMRAITRDLVNANVPVSKIKQTLQDFGYTAEEAGQLITFRFGPALNSLNQPVTVLGEQIPKLFEFSDGVKEVATALSTATGIDTNRLTDALRLGGTDPVAMAKSLAQAGVAFSDIQRAMEAMGVPASTAAQALAVIRAELQQVNDAGFRQGQIAEYSRALDQIRISADGAAGRATALLAAVDALNNEINASANIGVAFGASLEQIRKLGDEGSSALLKLSEAVDTNTNSINWYAPGLTEANNAFNTLAQTGLAATVQAMRDSAAAGGDFAAQQAAGAAVIDGQLRPVLDGLRADLEAQQAGTQITDEVWQQLLATYHLTPEEQITLAIAQTAQATDDVNALIRQINGVPGQPISGGPVVATFNSLTADAQARAIALGIDVRKVADDRYELTMSADPATARAQAQGLVSYINGLSASVSVDINVRQSITREVREIAEANAGQHRAGFNSGGGLYRGGILKRVGANPLRGLDPVKFYANGGVENHRAQIARAGTYRVWAEKETGGEAYIPLSPWKRNRSMQILRQVAGIFGKQVIDQDHQVRRYSNGYAPGASSGASEPMPMFHIDNWNQGSDVRPDAFAAEMNRRWQLYRR